MFLPQNGGKKGKKGKTLLLKLSIIRENKNYKSEKVCDICWFRSTQYKCDKCKTLSPTFFPTPKSQHFAMNYWKTFDSWSALKHRPLQSLEEIIT